MRVIAIAAMTADGKIARSAHDPVTWSSKEDKRMFAATSRHAGVIVMGRSTFESMPKPLEDRLQIVLTSAPQQFTAIPNHVEYSDATPQEVIRTLGVRGFQEVVIGGGASVYRQFIGAGLVDELWLTVEPLLFGTGVPLLSGESLDLRMQLLAVTQLSLHTLQLKYGLR